MKRIYIVLVMLLISTTATFAQGNSCAAATPFCTAVGTPFSFPNNTNTTAPAGPNYGCLNSEPNPEWFFIRTTAAGTMNFNISQLNTAGTSGLDVDFIAYGPFSSLVNACNNLTGSCSPGTSCINCDQTCTGNIEDCSYSTAATETMTLVSPGAGQYFLIMITNYSGAAGNITFTETSGPGTDCSVTCPTVTSGAGYVVSPGGANMPASVACNSAPINLIASANSPFGNPITPGIIISFTSTGNTSDQINWLANSVFQACAGPGACAVPITASAANDIQISTISPSATNAFQLCETNTTSANMPYTIIDAASGATLNTGTWVDDGTCQTITFPPGTISGVASWAISPACPGCLTTTDWGYATFNPGVAGAGTYSICYSFDPPGACATYTYCQSITVTNPYSGAWTTPAALCTTGAAINLNSLITGTAGGTWSGTGVSGTTFNPATSGAGTFNVTYTVGAGTCSAAVTHAITVNLTPTVSIAPATIAICAGASTTLTATPSTGGGTYSWAPGGATTAAITVSPAASTTYTVTYTLNGCSNTATRLVTVNPVPTVSINVPAAICAGGSATLTATPSTGGGTYSWAPGGATTASISVSPAATTTYTVTYTLNGCSGTASQAVTVNSVPTVTISPAVSTICSGASATLTATPSTGGGTYSWAPGGATTAAITVSPGVSTTYTVTYTLSGCSGTASRLITVNPTPTVTVNTPAAICSGGSATLTATPSTAGGTYSWAPGGATTTSISVSPGATTTYTVTYTLTGCSNTGTSTVTVNTTPTVSISPVTSTICAGSSAILTATPSAGGGTYSWSPGGATTAAITVSPGTTTTYTVTYTLAGCSATASRQVTVNPVPTVTVNTPSAICSGSSATLTATPSLGGGTYSWAPGGATTQSITVTPGTSTTYTVTYTLTGCSGTGSSTVTVNPTPTVSISPASSTICAGASATLTATPSLGGGTYSWAPGGAVTAAITVSPAATTTYTVTYTLAGCTATATRIVTVNPLDNATFAYGSSTYCQTGADPTATSVATAGTFSATPAGLVFLNTTTGLIDLSASALGSYTVTHTTTGTCPNTSSITITITSAPSATFSYSGPYCKNGTNPLPVFPGGSSAGTFTSTPAGLVFVSTSTGQINLTASTPGTYSITNTIAAAGGCASAVFGPVSVTINPSPTITATPALQTICSGTATNIALSSTLGSTTYNWTVTQTGVSGASAGTTPPIAQTLTTTGTVAGTATYTVTSTSGGCPGNTLTIPVTVNPVPTATASPTAQTICSGATTSISLTGSLPGTTFNWTVAQTGATGASAGSGSSIVQAVSATGTASGTVTYTIIPTANSCPGTPITVIITVNPTPVVTATPLTSTICSGSAAAVTLSSATAGTTFSWTGTNGTGISGASSASGTGISDVLTNAATTAGTATYVITPTAATCPGSPVTVTVNVNPTPNVTATPPAQTICSGSVTSIALAGSVSGTTFNWAAPTQTAASGGTAGSGTSIAQTLLATGASPGTVTYTVIPTANSCPGASIPVIITVNPVPFATATPSTATICSGATTSIALSSFTSGTTFSWTATATGSISGFGPASGTSIAQTLTNSGITAGTVTYVITPVAGGCPGNTTTVTINVNPVPNVSATPPAQSICSGSTTAITLSGTVSGTTFAWTAPAQSGATGGTADNGTTIAQVLTATGTSAGSVTYTIVPSANSCPGSGIPVIITVNPNPVGTATPAATTICSGTTTSIPLSSNIPGTTFSWTVASSGTTGESAGSGPSIDQTISTTGPSAGIVTYNVTATTPSGCSSTLTPITINVNPIPNVSTSVPSQTICSGTATNIGLTSAVAGTTFSWTTVETNATGSSAASGSTIAQVLTATATTPGTVAYTITPSANGCASAAPVTVTVTVNPLPVATATPPADSICNGGAAVISLSSNLGATSYSWTAAATGVTGAAAGAGSSISQILNLATSTVDGSVVYTITPTDNTCAGSPISITVWVNAIDNPAFNYGSSTFCQTGADPVAAISGTPGGIFTYIPTGLVLDSITGAIDVSASPLGMYQITYTTTGVCPSSAFVAISITNAPSAVFSYPTAYCSSDPNPLPAFGTGASAGLFTAMPSGLSIDTNTGEVNLSASTPGTYTVTNTIAPAAGCATATASTTIIINQAATVAAGLNDTICEQGIFTLTGGMGGSATSVVWTSNGSGAFSDTTNLTPTYVPSAADINAGSVVLTITTNDPAGTCPQVNDFMVLTITPLDSAEFSYSGGTFCQSGTNPVPTLTGVSGGVFTAYPAGVTFVSTSTGEINLGASTLGTYNVVYTTNGPCPYADTVSVTITTAPTATFSFTAGAAAFCQTGTDPSPVFGAGASGGVFTVSPSGLSFVSATSGQIDLSASTPGVYVLTNTIVAAGGCASAVDSMTITINQPALVSAGNDTAVCAGSAITIAGSSIGGSATASTWTSSGSGTFSDPDILGTTYTPSVADTTAGSVTLYLTTNDPAGACGAVLDSMVVNITALPMAPPVVTPPAYCAGSTVGSLTASSTGGTMSWYANSGLTTFLSNANPFTPTGVTGTTSFWVTETVGSCVSPASQVTINFNPLPVADTSATTLTSADCGTATGSITGVTMISGAAPYSYVWQNAGGATVDTTLNLTNVGPGIYTLTITDANGCVTQVGGSSSFGVTSTSAVVAAFTPDPVAGEKPLTVNFTNNSVGAVNYAWSFGTGANSVLSDPSYIYTQLGNFTVCLYADNGLGCADTACSTIDVYINSTFVIPNIFTPNDDGVNDIFTVKNVGLETLDAEVYNRWGQKEYEWHTTNGGWDGRTASGVFAPDGTYYFIISAKGYDGKEYFEKGGFSLIR